MALHTYVRDQASWQQHRDFDIHLLNIGVLNRTKTAFVGLSWQAKVAA